MRALPRFHGQEKRVIGWLNKGRWILLALALVLTASILNPGYAAAPSPQENVSLYAGNRLIISSTQQAIRSVVVRGNLSAAIVSNVTYPAKNFTLTTDSTQLYTLNIWLSYPSTYTTAITINDPVSRSNSLYTSYYVSAGDMNLTIFAGFIISLALMLGETVIISVAQYLFFVTLNLFPLVDLFSLFFVAVLGLIIYLAREGLDKFLDLKPMMED